MISRDVRLKNRPVGVPSTDDFQIAETHAWRGEIDAAFAWLQTAWEQRDSGLPEVKGDPLLRTLHSDPRWQAFLMKMGVAVAGPPPPA